MRGLGASLLLASLALACGADEPPEGAVVRAIGAPHTGEPSRERAREDVADAEAFEDEAHENRPPRILGLQLTPASDLAGQDVWVRAQVEDPEGDEVEIRYIWLVNGEEVAEQPPPFATYALRRGDTVRVRVEASDGWESAEPLESPLLTVANGLPHISSQPVGAGPDGIFRYRVQAEDPEDAGSLRYSLAKAPRGMTISPLGGLVEWTPGPDQGGVHAVEIVVEDADGGRARQRFELTMSPPEA